MSTFRPVNAVRLLVLGAAVAFVVSLPIIVVAQTAAPKPAPSTVAAVTPPTSAPAVSTPGTSTPTVASKPTKGGEAEEKNELDEHVQKMTQQLKLTDDQAAKVRSIMQTQMTQASELHAKYKGQPTTPESKTAMEKARKELHTTTDAKLAQVLTADQMTEYKKMRAEHMKKEGAKEEKEEAKGAKN